MMYRHVHIGITVLPLPGIRKLSFLPRVWWGGVRGLDGNNSIEGGDHKQISLT